MEYVCSCDTACRCEKNKTSQHMFELDIKWLEEYLGLEVSPESVHGVGVHGILPNDEPVVALIETEIEPESVAVGVHGILPNDEPVVALIETEPEPVVALIETEPEPVVALIELDTEPELVAVGVHGILPNDEPMVALIEPEPEPVAALIETEPVVDEQQHHRRRRRRADEYPKSRYVHVYWSDKQNKWNVRVKHPVTKKQKCGSFVDEIDAAKDADTKLYQLYLEDHSLKDRLVFNFFRF